MENDCFNCEHDKICCRNFGITLTREEIPKFNGNTKVVQLTESKLILGYVVVLKKKENGRCVYQDDESGLCDVYENRPQTCRKFNCIGRL